MVAASVKFYVRLVFRQRLDMKPMRQALRALLAWAMIAGVTSFVLPAEAAERMGRIDIATASDVFPGVPIDDKAVGDPNYQGPWWNPAESGWGVDLAHQGDVLYASWFTYDIDGNGMWLVMPGGAKTGTATYSGPLYRTTGPAFNSVPWNSAQVILTTVGTASFAFSNTNSGTFTYTVNGIAQTKAIQRQVYSSPVPTCVWGAQSNLALATNYQDQWWNSSESGWLLNIAHQGDILFATWFTYDTNGKGMWLVMSAGARTSGTTYSGALYRTTGPAFSAVPFTPIGATNITQVGTMTISFANGNSGTMTASVNGIMVTKSIVRQVFVSPGTVCSVGPPTYALSVAKTGAGSGTVTSSPAGISCGATCTANFDSGTAVTLTAAAASGSTFAGWSGGGCSGTGTCAVTMNAATTVTATINAASTVSTRLTNLSTRGQVQTGNNVMIGGFAISGTAPQQVLIRARGPSMIPAGVTNALADPTMTLVNQATGMIIGTNDNWGSASNASAITATSLAPTNPLESAMLITLDPGAYTVVVSGVNGGTGVGIVEVFAQ